MDCPFCDVDREIVSQNEFAIAVRDKFPVSKGHTLVIPKRHEPSLLELSRDEYLGAFALLRESTSVGWHAAGNFPRAELVSTCVDESDIEISAESAAGSSDRYDALRELKSLLDEGVITQEEYEQEKGELLAQ